MDSEKDQANLIKKSKRGNNWEIKYIIPVRTKRSNPYMEGEDVGDMPTVTGLIDEGSSEYGFAQLIDMDYKGKDDQWTDYFCKYWGSQDKFERICEDNKINIIYI